MTLRRKTLVIIGATLFCLVVVLYFTSKVILLGSFAELEKQETRLNVARVEDAIFYDLYTLNRTVGDWAMWDDTYAFIEDANDDYIKSNLLDETFPELKVSLILYINSSGRIVFEKNFDLQNNTEIPVSDGMREQLTANNHILNRYDTESSVSGIVQLPEGPMLIASRPILTSEGKGPSRGTLIMGRYLDSKEINRLAETTHLSLSVARVDDLQMFPDFQSAFSSLTAEAPVYVRPLNPETVAGYALLEDIYGKPALMMRVDIPREIYRQGQASMLYFILSVLAVGLVFGVVILLLLERMVLSRLARLSASVTSIGADSDLSKRVSLVGRDELSSLAGSVNGMLEALEQSQCGLRDSEAKVKALLNVLDGSDVGIFIVDADCRIVWLNRALETYFGLRREEVIGQDRRQLIHERIKRLFEFPERFSKKVLSAYKNNTAIENFECFVLPGDGRQERWLEHRSRPIRTGLYAGGRIEQYYDITGRKKTEDKLKYLSLHDPLTGLYNRTYFEREMRRLDAVCSVPAGIILCDVDGLKMINDTLGHGSGDALLAAAAQVIKKSLHKGDVVARIGGDEFAIMLSSGDKSAAKSTSHRIRKAVFRYNAENPELPLSISIGFASDSGAYKAYDDLFKEADNNMYREKLHRSQSTRSAIVQTLMKALEARDFITEGHADRLQDLVAGLATAMGLPENRVADLRLLAQFHDIGKVGIPDRILFKPGLLSSEEMLEMQRHCEIGHRIAQSAPDLAPIADWILKHHEWWNGSGYPLGLKGKEIPLECRLLTIVDAYDAMANDRPYRKAMTREEALNELRRYSGTQFDPHIVAEFIQVVETRN